MTVNAEQDLILGWKLSCPTGAKALQKYHVYLDDALLGETTETSYNLGHLAVGTYEAGVRAIYQADSSVMVTIEITVQGGQSNEDRLDAGIRVYPNPASSVVYMDGEYVEAVVVDRFGRVFRTLPEGLHSVSVEGWPAGLYLMRFVLPGNEVCVRRIVVM